MKISRTLGAWLAGLLVVIAPVTLIASPAPGRPVAVIASPWSAPVRAIELTAMADGRLLRPTSAPWIVIAVFEQPDFALQLWRLGAWLTVDAVLAEVCLRPSVSS